MGINGWAVIVASVVSFIFGFIWYGPLFGKQWMVLMKFTKKDMDKAKKKGMGKTMIIGFISTLVLAFILARLILMTNSVGAMSGMNIAFLVWIGFVATITLGSVLWENKSINLWFLNNAYHLINLLIIGAILGAWQ